MISSARSARRCTRSSSPNILKQYGDRVRIVYKDFPLTAIHPWAMHAAVDANCLFDQSNDAYWDFADRVHATQSAISEGHDIKKSQGALDKAANEIGADRKLDNAKLNACIAKDDSSRIENSIKEGDAAGRGVHAYALYQRGKNRRSAAAGDTAADDR